jgi:hypothetical protein
MEVKWRDEPLPLGRKLKPDMYKNKTKKLLLPPAERQKAI